MWICNLLQWNVFADWYESTGELLGEGAFGHVTTYRHNRTNKEFAVKVTNNDNNLQGLCFIDLR